MNGTRTPLLAVSGLNKRFGGNHVNRDIDLQVRHGEIRCLIGPNGAGKSTLLKLLFGVHPANSGSIRFDGRDVMALPTFRRAALGMSLKYQVPAVFWALTVEHSLKIARSRGQHHAWPLAQLLSRFGLAPLRQRRVSDLSHGQRQWLEIAMAIACRPKLLLLDEPTAGMTRAESKDTARLLHELNREGVTLIAVDHDMAFVESVASSVTVMHLGAVFREGSLSQMRADDEVKRIYLGDPWEGADAA